MTEQKCQGLLIAVKVGGFKLGTEPAEMELAARVERVLALHARSRRGLPPSAPDRCGEDAQVWPCQTVRLLDGEE